MELSEESPHLLGLERLEPHAAHHFEQLLERTPVVIERPRREPALVRQDLEEGFDQCALRMLDRGRTLPRGLQSLAATPAAHSSPMRRR